MTWHDWMQRLPVFCDQRSRQRRRATSQRADQRAEWSIESLERRDLLTINFQFDYSLDSSHFFDSPVARQALEQAGATLGGYLTDTLEAITPGGLNSWIAQFSNPGTGSSVTLPNLSIAANTLLIYVGARPSLGGGTVAESAPGGWYSGNSDDQWNDLLAARGQLGAIPSSAHADTTDFGPWGGSLSFSSSVNWYLGSSSAGIQPNQMDFLSVAQHELGHLLGFGTSASFDRYISGSVFTGPAATAANDGEGSPFLSGDRAHWATGTTDGGQGAAMDPSLGPGVRRLFTGLDFAALNDIGWNSNSGGGGGGGTSGSVIITAASNLQTTESGGTVSFTAALSSKPTANVTFNLSTSNMNEGFLSKSSLTFTSANWNLPQTVVVTGADDQLVDGNKAYQIVTSAVYSNDLHYNGFNPVDVSITNLDNDQPGITVTPTSGLVTTEQGGTSSFVVYLNAQPTSNVTLTMSSSNTKEGTISLSTLVFTPTNWMIAQIVTVKGVDDHVSDSNKTYSIILNPLTSADRSYAGLNPPDVSVISTSIPDLAPTIVLSNTEMTVSSEGNPAILDSGARVYDLDSPFLNLSGAKLIISLSRNGTSNDRLSIKNEGKSSGLVGAPTSGSITYGGVTIGSRSGGTGTTPLTITFNSKATLAMVQEVARCLQFQVNPSNRSALDRSVTLQLRLSSGETSNSATALVHVTTGAQPPVINLGPSALSYSNRSGAQLISPTASLVDSDSATFSGGKLTVSFGVGSVAGDVLRIRRQGTAAAQIDAAKDGTVKFGRTVIGSWSGGTNGKALVVTLKSTASQAAVQALIRNITFETSAMNTSLASRVIHFQVTDGRGGSSDVESKTIVVR